MSASAAEVLRLLDAAAMRHSVEPALARAVAWVESRFNPNAKSGAGAMGVMQLMPDTAKGLGVTDPWDAAQNVEGGVRFLAKLLARFGDVRNALAAYNWGPGHVSSGKLWPSSVEHYVSMVLARVDIERKQLGGAGVATTDPSTTDEGDREAATPLVVPPLASRSLARCPRCSSLLSIEAADELA